ncbi:MAG: hypothetical protein KatS3mg031_0200 [Chitinophagales bacterium]|nr:MAG: hypothetical protein KatS3mg031_0200 [Chitinophagales bacterium]
MIFLPLSRDQFGYEITQLSEGQAKYLLTFSSVHTIRSRAAASLGRLGADRRAQDCSRSDLSALALWAEKALSYGRAAVNTLHAPSLGEAAILRHNSATLDFNGFQPAYTRLESYDHLIDKASLQKVNYGQGGLKESLDIIRKYIRNYAPQVRKLAQHLRHPDTAQSCFNIWHFCKENIRYAFDAPGKEQLRTPARTWNDRLSGVDCDDFTIFCACLLQQMGIPWKLKLAAFHGRPNYSHIYLIVPTSGLSGTDKIVHPVPASHHTFRSFHEAEKWARQNITGKHFNHDLGEFIWISNNAISKFLSHSSVNKSAHPNVHLSALMILPQLIASAVVGQRHPDKKEAVDIKEILRLYAALVLDQVLYPVKITVKVFRNDNIHRAYNYEVIKVEMPEGKPVTSLFSDENRTSGISMSKLLQIIQSDNSPDAALSGPGCIVIDAVMNRFNADPPGITKSFTMDIQWHHFTQWTGLPYQAHRFLCSGPYTRHPATNAAAAARSGIKNSTLRNRTA